MLVPKPATLARIVITTRIELAAIERDLTALYRLPKYDFAAYKRMIWEAHKANNPHVHALCARVMPILDTHGFEGFAERVDFTLRGKSLYAFQKAFIQYVVYMRDLLDAPVPTPAPVAAKTPKCVSRKGVTV